MIDRLGLYQLPVFSIQVIPMNHVLVVMELLESLQDDFFCFRILVILDTLLLENLDSKLSLACQEILFIATDRKVTNDLILVKVNLDTLLDH